ncbi:hypothetical protein DN051_39590 [Streptomyces cadmiisoli]|uniref:Uncharacterized protein n=1 Tax=Streptomyces cadmiisoli TaxID=2184053 RepID=A0A2Z4JA70_9ACTN|nr:hypothetical protein DN051_39590 [Streptomyces cadmiisoli]
MSEVSVYLVSLYAGSGSMAHQTRTRCSSASFAVIDSAGVREVTTLVPVGGDREGALGTSG